MLAGAPAELNVTALRKELVTEPDIEEPENIDAVEAPAEIEETPLDPVATAAAAIDAAAATPAATPKPTPAPRAPRGSSLEKPFIQIGIFSVEANANRDTRTRRPQEELLHQPAKQDTPWLWFGGG